VCKFTSASQMLYYNHCVVFFVLWRRRIMQIIQFSLTYTSRQTQFRDKHEVTV